MKIIYKIFPIIPIAITLYGHWNLCNVYNVSLISLILNVVYITLFLISTIGSTIMIRLKKKLSWSKSIVAGTIFSLVFIGFIGMGRKTLLLLIASVVIIGVYFNRSEIKNIAIDKKIKLEVKK